MKQCANGPSKLSSSGPDHQIFWPDLTDQIAQKHARMQCTYIIVLEMYIFDTDEAFQKVREDMPKILSALFDVMLMIHWHFLMKLSSY